MTVTGHSWGCIAVGQAGEYRGRQRQAGAEVSIRLKAHLPNLGERHDVGCMLVHEELQCSQKYSSESNKLQVICMAMRGGARNERRAGLAFALTPILHGVTSWRILPSRAELKVAAVLCIR